MFNYLVFRSLFKFILLLLLLAKKKLEIIKYKNTKLLKKILFKYFLYNFLSFNLKKKKLRLLYIHLNNLLSEFFFSFKTFELNNKIMFMVHSNKKQYFLSFVGYNFQLFITLSTGKLLKFLQFTDYKKFKKSKKNLKILIKYFKNMFNDFKENNLLIYYYYLKPLNLKNLLVIFELFKTFNPVPCIFGFQNYYKSIFGRVQRIKKKIKKKLLKTHTY